jgi:hypothetical protein
VWELRKDFRVRITEMRKDFRVRREVFDMVCYLALVRNVRYSFKLMLRNEILLAAPREFLYESIVVRLHVVVRMPDAEEWMDVGMPIVDGLHSSVPDGSNAMRLTGADPMQPMHIELPDDGDEIGVVLTCDIPYNSRKFALEEVYTCTSPYSLGSELRSGTFLHLDWFEVDGLDVGSINLTISAYLL